MPTSIDLSQVPSPKGQVQLLETLGKGNFGYVYKAKMLNNNQLAAVKIVQLVQEELTEILLEAEILRHCQHPNIVAFIGMYLKSEHLWISMELCSGGAMDWIYRNYPKSLSEDQICIILSGALKGLQYLHDEVFLIHRDIKSGNILITESGEVKLADFGVSAKLPNKLARRSSFIGMPYWMAPEVVAVEDNNRRARDDIRTYDSRSDIWSIGITAIELADKAPPYADLHPMRAIHVLASADIFLQKPDKWSKRFNEFIAECLVRNPQERPTAAQLLSQSPWLTRADNMPKAREMIVDLVQKAKAAKAKSGGQKGAIEQGVKTREMERKKIAEEAAKQQANVPIHVAAITESQLASGHVMGASASPSPVLGQHAAMPAAPTSPISPPAANKPSSSAQAERVRKAMFLTAPLNIRIPYQVMTADVLGTYLLIGTDKGLLACDLTSAAAPRGRLRVVVKDVAFRQIRVLEEYGQLIALSGKNSHLRSYKLTSIRALVEWTFHQEILSTQEVTSQLSFDGDNGGKNGATPYSSPVMVRPPNTEKVKAVGPTLARGMNKDGVKLSAEDKDLYALRNEAPAEEESEAERVNGWQNDFYKILNTKYSLSFSITKTARTTYLGALNRDGVTVFEWADDPYMKFMELKPFWTPEKPIDYEICHDGQTITGVWLGYKQEANFVRFEDSQVVEIAANPDLVDPSQKGSWTGMIAVPRQAHKTASTNPAMAAKMAADRVMTMARNPALAASVRTSNPDLFAAESDDTKPPMYLATVGVLSRFVELDGQPTGPYAKMIYKWSSEPATVTVIRAPEKENGVLIGYCRESIDVLDIQTGAMLQSVRHMNVVRCLTDAKRGRIFLGSYKSYPQRFSNMYFWMENKDELERHLRTK